MSDGVYRFTETPYNGLSPHNRPDRAAFQFPAIERRIARHRLESRCVDGPLQLRVDQRDIRGATNRQSSGVDLQQSRRVHREHLNQPRQLDRFGFVNEQIEK